MQFIYTQLRRGFLGLVMLGLLAACQSKPVIKPLFNDEQVATLKEQGFTQTDEGWELSFTDKLLFEFDAAKLVPPSRNAISLVGAADEAMYRAKQAQRGTRQVARLPQPHPHP